MDSVDVTLSQISHYQKKLSKYANTGETEKVLGCIHKLKYLPVTVNHLLKTGVGKDINALRHRNGIIGERAKVLLNKWKSMVHDEEQEEETQDSQEAENPPTYEMDEFYNPRSPTFVENEEYDPSDDGDKLHIEEQQAEECEEATYNPGGKPHLDEEEEDDTDNAYNPRTSREDYVSIGDCAPVSYKPSSKVEKNKRSTDGSPGQSSRLSNHIVETKAHSKHAKSESEEKHRKKHKSKREHDEKRKSSHKTSTSSSHHKKLKTKEKESLNKEKDKSKAKPSHSSSSIQEGEVSSTTSPPAEAKKHKETVESQPKSLHQHGHSRDKETDHSKSKEKKSHKSSKSSKGESKSSKRKIDVPVGESSCDFEAALMGMDSAGSKKKKKDKGKVNQSSASSPHIPLPRKDNADGTKPSRSPVSVPSSPTNRSNDTPSDSKASSRSKYPSARDALDASEREHLPQLPSTFEDDLNTQQLMPNYKPLPQVPQRHATRDLFDPFNKTDEEALNYMLLSKSSNKQRKIYAGKSTWLPVVPSLFQTCIRVLQENIDALEATGGIPFDLLRPVLEKASPDQLDNLEYYNPYLLDDTDVLWASHCKKHCKTGQREDTESWRDMFFRCKEEAAARMRRVTESLGKKYVTDAPPKRITQLAFVNTVAKAPRSVIRAQAKYRTASAAPIIPKPSRPDERAGTSGSTSASTSSSSSSFASRPDRPFPHRPGTVKKRVAPLMGKAKQLLKFCRR